MQDRQPSLLTRPDTLFGVCEALGRDFGFNPVYPRILFATTLLWNPAIVCGVYLALGVVVALAHLLIPSRPRKSAITTRRVAERLPATPIARNDERVAELAAAA